MFSMLILNTVRPSLIIIKYIVCDMYWVVIYCIEVTELLLVPTQLPRRNNWKFLRISVSGQGDNVTSHRETNRVE